MAKTKNKKTPAEEAKKSIEEFFDTAEWGKFKTKLRKVKLKPVKDPFKTLKGGRKLLTHTVLDEILGRGGVSAKKLVLAYGEYGTGKTQLAYTLLVEAAQEGTVIFNDSEFSFSPDRVEEIARERGKDIEKVMKNLILFQPEDWMEHLAFPEKVPSPLDLDLKGRPRISLVIVDSLIAPFDRSKDFMGRQHLPLRSQMFRLFFAELRRIARLHDCPVFITNQVISVPNIPNPKYTPMWMKQRGKGGPTVEHIPDIIVYLRKSTSGTRVARLMDSYELEEGERIYMITKRGIDDVPTALKEKFEKNQAKKKEKLKPKQSKKDSKVEIKEEPQVKSESELEVESTEASKE